MRTLIVVGAAATALVGSRTVLRRQAAQARALIGKPLGESAPLADKTWKRKYGDRLDLVVLGDSVAAGLGADAPKHTLGGRLARKLARRTGRGVRLRTVAVVGSESRDLPRQLASLSAGYRPDVAVIVVGGNDVTHRLPVAESVAHLVAAIEDLSARGADVVVGTCPDLGVLRPVPQPLRSLAGRASRQLAAAQRRGALDVGARVVDLGTLLRPHFHSGGEELFSLDRFHPSNRGYARAVKALLPSVLAALGEAGELPPGHHAPPA